MGKLQKAVYHAGWPVDSSFIVPTDSTAARETMQTIAALKQIGIQHAYDELTLPEVNYHRVAVNAPDMLFGSSPPMWKAE